MRPAIKAGLLLVWRDPDTLQIGIDPRRAIAITGMTGAGPLIGLLDGSRDEVQVLAAAQQRDVPQDVARRVLTLLLTAGVLQDFPAATLRGLPDGPRARLAPELAAASLAHGDTDGGARILARRQLASVRVLGTGPVGASLAGLLSAAGVGHVICSGPAAGGRDADRPGTDGPGTDRPGTDRPAGHGPSAEGPAAEHATRHAASGGRPDLAVLTSSYPPELATALLRQRIPHFVACASEAIGAVGPLVLPGWSACLNCVQLARTDRDPAWPFNLAQIAGRDPQPPACDTTLATAVAAQAAGQLLTFLDRAAPAGAVTNGTLELVLPGWQWRRRTWLPHPACSCGSYRRPG